MSWRSRPAYANLCIAAALKHVRNLGSLQLLRLAFDSGNHFRSYENAYYQLVQLPMEFDRNVQPSFMCEKHGKGPDDAEIFGPVWRWLDQHLLLPEAAELSKKQAAAEQKAKRPLPKPPLLQSFPKIAKKERPKAFLDDETQLVRALQQQAGLEMMQNPDGTKFII